MEQLTMAITFYSPYVMAQKKYFYSVYSPLMWGFVLTVSA